MTENLIPMQEVTIFEGDQGPDYVRWIERHRRAPCSSSSPASTARSTTPTAFT